MIITILTKRFIKIEPLVPNTLAQNRGGKRLGGVITEKARAICTSARLLEELWLEITKAVVYLYNRCLKYIYNWKTPYDRFYIYLVYRNGIVVEDR